MAPSRLLLLSAVFCSYAGSLHAVSIGVSFTGGGNVSSPAVSLLSTDSAGVVPQVNYNNILTGVTFSNANLLNDSGTNSGVSLTGTGGGGYSTISGAGITPQGGDEKLNTGFEYGNVVLTLSGISFAQYDIYVYELNDAANRVSTSALTGGPTYYLNSQSAGDPARVDQNAGTTYQYVQATSTNLASPTNANYVKFSGLTGASQTINVSATGNGFVNGFQIVQVPEPGSATLLCVSALGLGLLRRRRQA